ncbi:hypothetical protein JCGZ_22538 [Jatropha curcas]|uniref:Transcription elongation factor 1 homolog n=1 Tax=Jatropha curcas TaxID=180498 RepID=A0A067JPD0_JATCU|nr:hypothetical protein JCGZ_22538 [Jatropha curcas]
MARRKTKRVLKKPVRVEKLETTFTCPFCNHRHSVACVIDRKLGFGEAECSVCKVNYVTKINPLTEPIDIYSEWIDECVGVNTA